MATGDITVKYAASASITWTLASLSSDTNLVAGRASAAVDNGTNLYRDFRVAGKIAVGTTPTANTWIELWVIPILDDSPTWPDAFGGTDANVTVTSRGILRAVGKLALAIAVDATTSNRAYPFEFSLRDVCGGSAPPKQFQLFAVHNTAVALNSTGGNHVAKYIGLYDAVA